MIVYLSVEQALELHRALLARFGGRGGLRDRGALEAAIARPAATFDGEDLYPDLAAKAAALMHSLVMNHPFIDGNKRVGVSVAELFVLVNGAEIATTDAELEATTLAVARGERDVQALAIWLRQRIAHRE